MHESSNKAISAHRRRTRSRGERNSVNIQILATFLGAQSSYFQLQPVLYLAKCMFVFDTAGLAFFEGIALEKKKKKSHYAG